MLAASRASLILQGLVKEREANQDGLETTLLEGRYSELVMLFYIGKDLFRWLTQCVEFASKSAGLSDKGLGTESFAGLLVEDTPERVTRKLRSWGVYEYRDIFSRGLGLQAIFESVPPMASLKPDFLRQYHRYADHMFACWRQLAPHTQLDPTCFDFELYASGEYSKKLEQEWGA